MELLVSALLLLSLMCCQLEARVSPQRRLRRSIHDVDDVEDLMPLTPHVRSARAAPSYFLQQTPDPDASNTCLTGRCVRRGERMLDALDHSVDPCDNFAKYACGGRFLRDKTSGADDSPSENMRKRNYINTFIKSLLDSDNKEWNTMAEERAQKFYTTCKRKWFTTEMGSKVAEKIATAIGADHIVYTGTSVNGGHKTLGAILHELDEEWGVQFAPAATRFRNESGACSVLVHDGGDYTHFDDDEDLATEEDIEQVGSYLMEGLELAEEWTATVKETCKEDTSIRQTTVRQLVRNAPEFGWPEFLGMSEGSVTPIYIQGCVMKLTKDLFKMQMNYPMKLKTMLVARALRRLWKKVEEDDDTSDDCLTFTTKYFGPALTSMYLMEPRHAVNLAGTQELMTALAEALQARLERATWIDATSRNFYINKLKDMRYVIGYDEKIVDNREDLEAHYFTTTVRGAFPGDLNRLARWHYSAVARNCDVAVWESTQPLAVQGMYQNVGSALVAPLGLVSGTQYHPDQPSVLNYAALGADLGLLLMFTLDKDFRDTDAWGNKYNISKNTLKKLDSEEECLHKHFSKTADDDDDDADYGSYTAELHGLKLAYAAWKARGGLDEQLLPGISELYSPQQIFYILFAQMNCNNAQPAGHEQLVSTLSLIPEVAQLWKCPVGSKLNPAQQCKLW